MQIKIALPVIGSSKGISPPPSHRTVLESLPSYGSSYAIASTFRRIIIAAEEESNRDFILACFFLLRDLVEILTKNKHA